MKTLWLLRHAKSAWNTNAPSDFERPLAKRGRRDAPKMGQWLAGKQVTVDRVVCSTATRARQTLKGVCEHWPVASATLTYSDDLYHAGTQTLVTELHGASHAEQSLMLVGHNPGLDSLLVRLVGRDQVPQTDNYKMMTTAALAQVELEGWQAKSGRLLALIRPKELASRFS